MLYKMKILYNTYLPYNEMYITELFTVKKSSKVVM